MSEFKHTPGPWIVSRTSGLEIFINHDHDRPDRVPGYFAEVRRFTSDHEQVEANARLIAAAPELLEALLELIDIMQGTIEGDYKPDSFTLQPARAAIAKATGE